MPATRAAGIWSKHAKISLENDLSGELHRSRIARVVDLSESSIRYVCARERGEVRMVENVENFPSQLKRLGFAEANFL